jgi:hypothetical protein
MNEILKNACKQILSQAIVAKDELPTNLLVAAYEYLYPDAAKAAKQSVKDKLRSKSIIGTRVMNKNDRELGTVQQFNETSYAVQWDNGQSSIVPQEEVEKV